MSVNDLLMMRESECAPCELCGGPLDYWETSIPLERVVDRLWADADAFREQLGRRCPTCDELLEWDVAIIGETRDTLSLSRQRRLAGTIRRLIREHAGRPEMVEEIRGRYGVVGFYVGTKERILDRLREPSQD